MKLKMQLKRKKVMEMIGKSTFDIKLPIPKKFIIEEVKKMIIKKLTISSFRGIKNVEFDFDKKINVLSGKNGLGKTTVIDSILWVFTDETLVYGKQNADNRNTDDLREPVYVKVEALNDNANYVFERKYYDSYKEDYNGNLVFSKVVNEFKINGVKYGSKEYFEFIKKYILKLDESFVCPKDYNILRSVMDYNYFGSIDYKVARSFLEKVLVLENDDEIISSEKYVPIKADLQSLKFDFSKAASRFKARAEEAKQQIVIHQKVLEDCTNEYSEEALKRLAELVEKRDLIFNEDLSKNSEILALNNVLKETQEFISKQTQNENKANLDLQNKINRLIVEGNSLNVNISRLGLEQENAKENASYAQTRIKELLEEKNKIENKQFKVLKCSNCGNVVNKDELEKFEIEKKKKINAIEEKISSEKNKITELNAIIEKFSKGLEETKEVKRKTAEEYFVLKEELLKLDSKVESKEILEAKKTLEKIQNKLEELKVSLINEKQRKFNELNKEIEKLIAQKTLPQKIESEKEAIKNLKTNKALNEQKIDLVKDFKETKLNKIKEKINVVFPTLDIEILEENVNTGTIKEVCYLKLKNTEYKGINDGHRKMIGITFIENIKNKLGLENLPLVFDKFADIDDEMLQTISNLTNSQIFATKVGNENTITLL